MDEAELCRIRAAEYHENFESLRSIEWRNALEVFSGYALIAVAYWQVHDKFPDAKLPGLGAVLLTIILYGCNLYLSLRIQERLHFTHAMQNTYLARIHTILGVPQLEATPPGTVRRPIHGRWYAFAVQTILSSVAMISILAFVILATCGCSGRGV